MIKIKNLSKIYLFLVVIGLCFLISGAIFRYLNFPDTFKGIYSGSFLIIISLILLIVKQKPYARGVVLSSYFTPIFKFIFPIVFVILMLLMISPLLTKNNFTKDAYIFYIVFDTVFISLGLFIVQLWTRLTFVFFYEENVYINNYLTKRTVHIDEIQCIKPYAGLFYCITYIYNKEKKKNIFMPRYIEFFPSKRYGSPIKKFKDKLEKR